ncbi:MAG: hypothetical protein ABIG39_05690 [Candidatus Micrarchaeota archaeon]
MKKKRSQQGHSTIASVSFLESVWEDEGRRVVFLLFAISCLGILLVLILNLYHRPVHDPSLFSNLQSMQENVNKIFLPIGFLMAMQSLLIFSLAGTYGKYTEVRFLNKSIHARTFFRKLSFYIILIGTAFLLSSGVADSIIDYS